MWSHTAKAGSEFLTLCVLLVFCVIVLCALCVPCHVELRCKYFLLSLSLSDQRTRDFIIELTEEQFLRSC